MGRVTTVRLVRHGETRSYASDTGLTPRGVEQARRRGAALAEAVGAPVRVLTARSNRARETAEQLRRGLLERRAEVGEPEARAEFDNFAVATPQGRREITAAHGEYVAARESHGTGPPPGWVLDVGRFWAAQEGGGDPIRFWLTVPLLAFEPPSLCVRRFWSGVRRVVAEGAAADVVVATHSGPMRAFATAALGVDLGEPDNAEVVTVRVDGALASVAYRDRHQELRIPDAGTGSPWGPAP
jgi:broad specificity phosphatase PhoE